MNRKARKFSVSRPSRPSVTVSTIVLPLLCLALLILPQFNFSGGFQTLSETVERQPQQQQQDTANPTVVTDNHLEANARRARPLPQCAASGKQAKSFLMVFMGHSGSTAMISELRRHSKVHIEGSELVDHQKVFNTTAALETISAFFDKGISFGKTPGFKIRPTHILNEPELFKQLVKRYDTHILWQYRQNLFKASVGEYATRYLNDTRGVEGLKKQMTQEEKCNHAAGCSFRIENFEFLHVTLRKKMRSHGLITSAVNVLSDSSGCVREIPYEDYLYNRAAVMGDIQRFLGLPHEETQPERFKATGDSMCDVVENWNEVCTAFYGCLAWQSMMDDAQNKCFCNYTTGPTTYCKVEL